MRRLALLLLVPVAVGGCGGVHITQEESAGGTVDTLVRACMAGRAQVALEVLTPSARDALVNAPDLLRGCLDLLGLRDLAAARVGRVRANDQSATADLSGSGGQRSRVELEKSRGEWYVTHGAAL
jgi:hypothetical protein